MEMNDGDTLILPRELEREIFELAGRNDRGTSLKLVLVASRVQTWIEPLLYNVIKLMNSTTTELFLRTINEKPSSLFAENVKALFLSCHVEESQAKRILSVCSGIKDLAYWVYPSGTNVIDVGAQFFPERLEGRLGSLIHSNADGRDDPPNLDHPLFQHITHLSFPYDWLSSTDPPRFDLLPRLTHLFLELNIDRDNPEAVVRALQNIFSGCKTLRICVCFFIWNHTSNVEARASLEAIEEPRLVLMNHTPLWEISARGEPNGMWLQAEATSKQRWEGADRDFYARRRRLPEATWLDFFGSSGFWRYY